ncbi:MAG: DNA cytosine methyltransferase [Bacillus sp. (in: Bacteria)]|nr:DNA cytosine methyltransferase [Bacillus sp. (in: firmicutes)]
MKFLDLFAGIGGFRLGMEMAGHECVGFVESDPFCSKCKKITKHIPSDERNFTICTVCNKKKRQNARFSYENIHDTEGEWTAYDITAVTDDDLGVLRGKGIDVICGGFPCQAFSIAGKRGGFEDTRGTLFFEIARFAKQIKPRFLFLENVKGLLSHEKGRTFGTILNTLDELGYDCQWQVLNSKNFGVPQNRERVFIIGHLRGTSGREIFPIRRNDETPDIKIIGTTKNQHAKGTNQRHFVHDDSGIIGSLTATDYKQPKQIILAGNLIRGNDYIKRVYDKEGLAPALSTMQGGNQEPKVVLPVLTPDRINKRQNGRRIKEDGEPMFTLTTQDRHGVMIKEATKKGYDVALPGDSVNYTVPNSKTRRGRVGEGIANTLDTGCQQGVGTPEYKIRKLTPRECFRLQGFPDWAFDKAAEVNSDSQLYKQAGNSVTVNVIYEIASRLG